MNAPLRLPSSATLTSPLHTINFHLWKPCNARCTFCFATFRDVHRPLSLTDQLRLLDLLAEGGCQKVNFAGGEPTLYRELPKLILHAKDLGLTTSMVTNGYNLPRVLESAGHALDWCALSIDAGSPSIQQAIGRGDAGYVRRTAALADACRTAGVGVKLNTVVCRLNLEDRMHDVVRQVRPQRWKVFQVLRVEGQNDGAVEALMVSSNEFHAWLDRHRDLEREGYPMIVEDNDAMTDSYVMIDPAGRFYGNSDGRHRNSDPILEVGLEAALLSSGFREQKLEDRGGVWGWARQV